jgi:MFS family permease
MNSVKNQKRGKFFALLVLINIMGLAAAAILSPIVKDIAQAFSVQEDEIYYIQTITLIATAIFTIFWAFIADKYERIKVLRGSIIIWTVFCFLSILARDPLTLLLFQIVMVFGIAAIIPTTYSMTTDLIHKYGRSESFGWLSMAQNLGSGFAFLLGGFLIDFSDWRTPFIILSVLGTLGLPLLFFKFKEPQRGQMEEELCAVFEQCKTYNYRLSLKDFRMVIKPTSNFLILASGFISIFCTGAIGYTFVTMMRTDHQCSSTLATIFLIIIFIPQIFFPILLGKISDKRAEKNPTILIKILIVCTIITIIGYSIGFLIPFKFAGDILIEGTIFDVLLFVIILFFSLGFASGIPPMLFSALSYLNPPETRATIYSISEVTRSIGRGVGIAIMAFLAVNVFNGFYSVPMTLSTLFLLISAVLIIPIFITYSKDIAKLQEKLKERAQAILSRKNI